MENVKKHIQIHLSHTHTCMHSTLPLIGNSIAIFSAVEAIICRLHLTQSQSEVVSAFGLISLCLEVPVNSLRPDAGGETAALLLPPEAAAMDDSQRPHLELTVTRFNRGFHVGLDRVFLRAAARGSESARIRCVTSVIINLLANTVFSACPSALFGPVT